MEYTITLDTNVVLSEEDKFAVVECIGKYISGKQEAKHTHVYFDEQQEASLPTIFYFASQTDSAIIPEDLTDFVSILEVLTDSS